MFSRLIPNIVLITAISVVAGCNTAPPQCAGIDDSYVLDYRYLGPSACPIGPYQLDLNAVGSGIVTSTNTRLDSVIITELNPRGCKIDLTLQVTHAESSEMLAEASGTLTVYNRDSIVGVVEGTRYDGTATCGGQYELSLRRVGADMPMAGNPQQ